MRRRTLILGATGLGAMGTVAAIATRAIGPVPRGAPKVARIGALNLARSPVLIAALRAGLANRGWVEGQNLVLELRDPGQASADPAAFVEPVRDLVELHVDVLLTNGSPATLAAQHVTDQVPIVFNVDNAVGQGIVATLTHPGGNATGVENLTGPGLGPKRLELLVELVPNLSRVASLTNLSNPATFIPSTTSVAALTLGLQFKTFDVRQADDLEPAFATIAAWPAEGVLLSATEPFLSFKDRVGRLALQYRLPLASSVNYVAPGMLGYYAFQPDEVFDICARKVDQILRGALPGDLPVEQPTRFDLVLSRSTLQTLGMSHSQDVLARVTQWIE